MKRTCPSRASRGLTLLELLIVLAILTIVSAILVQSCGVTCNIRGSGEHAEQEARAHARKLGWAVKGVACTGSDSQGDGYISCTVVLEDQTERALQCASGGVERISGCKADIIHNGQGLPYSGLPENPDNF